MIHISNISNRIEVFVDVLSWHTCCAWRPQLCVWCQWLNFYFLLLFSSFYNRGRLDLWGHRRFGVQWREEGSVLCWCPDRDSLRHSIIDRKFWLGFLPSAVKSCHVMKWQWRIILLFSRRIIVAQRLYCRGRHQHRPDACFTQTT